MKIKRIQMKVIWHGGRDWHHQILATVKPFLVFGKLNIFTRPKTRIIQERCILTAEEFHEFLEKTVKNEGATDKDYKSFWIDVSGTLHIEEQTVFVLTPSEIRLI